MALNRRCSLHDLMASVAFKQGDPEPLTRTSRVGERDQRRCVWRLQYTAGARPPEPLSRSNLASFGRSGHAFVNGAPGMLLRLPAWSLVAAFTVAKGRIVAIDIVADPDKLRGLPLD